MRALSAERAVTFVGGDVVLAGIVTPPAAEGRLRGLGAVVVPGGLTRRVGLHRMYVDAARALAAAGAAVLRFDLPGVGESEGDVKRVTRAGLASLEAWYVPEIRAALDCLERDSPEAIMLVGHCNGARSAVMAAAEDPRVRGIAAWSMPVGSDADPAPLPELDRALRRLGERAVPVLWMFGTRDPALEAFQGYLAGHGDGAPRGYPTWTLREVAAANHDFTGVAWTREVIDGTLAWILEFRSRLMDRERVGWTSG